MGRQGPGRGALVAGRKRAERVHKWVMLIIFHPENVEAITYLKA